MKKAVLAVLAVVVVLVLVSAAYLAGRGWDDAVGQVQSEEAIESPPVATRVFDDVREGLSTLRACNGQVMCITMNNLKLEDAQSGFAGAQPREASIALSKAYGDWQSAHGIYTSQWCEQEENELCGEAIANLDAAAQTLKAIITG